MDALVRQGKVLYWGTSEWPVDAILDAHAIARAHGLQPPTMEQPQYNLLHRERVEREYASLYRDHGMGTTTWSPLASGLLTGKYAAGVPADSRMAQEGYAWLQRNLQGDDGARRVERARRFAAIARELGVDPAPLAIAWCLRNPDVSTVILGASRVEQLQQNLVAPQLVSRFDADIWKQIEAATA
jgi:aryl-alcohol dehydrogenase-like predicted oxidoreductase